MLGKYFGGFFLVSAPFFPPSIRVGTPRGSVPKLGCLSFMVALWHIFDGATNLPRGILRRQNAPGKTEPKARGYA